MKRRIDLNRFPLKLKLVLPFIIMIVIITVILTTYFYRTLKTNLTEDLKRYSLDICKYISYNSAYGVLIEDKGTLDGVIKGIQDNEQISFIIILNAEGKIIASFARKKDFKKDYKPFDLPDKLKLEYLEGDLYKNILSVFSPVVAETEGGGELLDFSEDEEQGVAEAKEANVIGQVHLGIDLTTLKGTLSRLRLTSLLISVIIIVIGFLIIILISKNIRNIIYSYSYSLKNIAGGDFTREVTVYTQDEIGVIGGEINRLVKRLKELIGDIKTSSLKLSSSATEVLTSSEELNSGATESAASIEEATSTIEEFSTTSRQISENSEIVSSFANDTLESGLILDKKMVELLESMGKVEDSSRDTTERIMKLGEQSHEIENIIEIIEDVATQTKLLSINASIEAIGAGEAGKRFSVVADEVKNLAESVSNSTKRIKEVVETIRESIDKTVISTEYQIKDVNTGSEKIVEVKEFVKKLKSVMEKTSDASKQIKISTVQQKTGADQFLATMKDISNVSNQTATSTRQLVSLVENLNKISDDLKGMSDYFKI